MENKRNIRLPEEEVTVKISTCNKCKGFVRVAVEHMMDTKAKHEFAKEALENNLSIHQEPLLEFRKKDKKFCECNSEK